MLNGKTTKYAVTFNILKPGYKSRTKIVRITEGYSVFEDIRKIISITLTVKPEDIDVTALVKMEE